MVLRDGAFNAVRILAFIACDEDGETTFFTIFKLELAHCLSSRDINTLACDLSSTLLL